MNASKEQPQMTAGLDIGDKYSYPSASSISRAVRLWRKVCSAYHSRGSEAAFRFGAASYAHRNGGGDSLAVGEQGAKGMRPRGIGGQCSQTEAHLCQQA